jgi:hypothetical protein
MIEFSFQLRICLHLQSERSFQIGDGLVIQTSEVIRREHPELGTSQNMEVLSDIDSGFRFTRLTILVPDRDENIPADRLQSVYEKEVLTAVNYFIDSYRHVTGRFGIANIPSLYGYPGLNVQRQGGSGVFVISFGSQGEGISQFRGARSPEEHGAIEQLLNENSLRLEQLFMMDARRYSVNGHETQALINAVIALDIAIRNNGEKPRSKLTRFWLKIFYQHKALVRLVTKVLSEKNMDEGKIGDIVGAIRERNKIIHDGRRRISGSLERYLDTISEAIELLD